MTLDKKFITLEREIMRMSKMAETTVTRNYKNLLNELRITLGRIYQDYEIEGQLTFDEMVKYDRLQKLDKLIEQSITSVFKDTVSVTRGVLKGIVEETNLETFKIVDNELTRKLNFIMKDYQVDRVVNTKMAGLRWTERYEGHRKDIINTIQRELRTNLTKGVTYGEMSKNLSHNLGISAFNSRRIIRTESGRCHVQAKKDSLDYLAEKGVKMNKVWITSRDERVRHTDVANHVIMDNVTIPYEDYFTLSDGTPTFAPLQSGVASQDINCRCILSVRILKGGDGVT